MKLYWKGLSLTISLVIVVTVGFVFFSSNKESVKICSWNIKDFGKSKDDKEIAFIANTVKDYDIIAIQEVVAGYGGSQAVAKLNDELNRLGSKWDYTISDPTYGESYKTERYAFIWKTSKVKKVGEAWLEQQYKVEIDREPYYATFSQDGKEFTLVNFHAITKAKQPETEIKYFKYLPPLYPKLNLIFCGDFNLPQSHTVFNPLKSIDYKSVLENQKTSLKKKRSGEECLASEFDNIFYSSSKIMRVEAGIVHFYNSFSTLEEANRISDHVPVYLKFKLK